MEEHDSKLITENQQLGIENEYHFAAYATQIGLIPTKCGNDFGFDFLCQVKGEQIAPKVSRMEGKFIAVSVRSTSNKNNPKIQIDKKDAKLFLSCNFPFLVALVHKHPKKEVSFFLKLPDDEFIHKLIKFVNSDRYYMTISAKDCVSGGSKVLVGLATITSNGYSEKIRHLIRELTITHILPSSRLSIHRRSDDSLSIIELQNFEDQFDISTDNDEAKLIQAAFGREDLVGNRLKHLKLKCGLVEATRDLPNPVILSGPAFTTGEKVLLTCSTKTAEASCYFEYRRIKTHYGFYHKSGLSLIISESRKHEGKHVHWFNCNVDNEANTIIKDHPDLCEFLKICIDESQIRIENSSCELPSSNFLNLRPLGYLVTYLSNIPDTGSLDLSGWRLMDSDEEDLQSLRVLSIIYSNKSALNGWGFRYDVSPEANLAPQKNKLLLPLCMNLKNMGIICWLEVIGTFCLDSVSNYTVGLRINETINFEIEKTDRRFPTSGVPEFKICAEWPAISFYMHKITSVHLTYDDWDVQVKVLASSKE